MQEWEYISGQVQLNPTPRSMLVLVEAGQERPIYRGLNDLGQERWQLVSIFVLDDMPVAVFKRAKLYSLDQL